MNTVTSKILHALQNGPQHFCVLEELLRDHKVPVAAWLATLKFQGLIRQEAGDCWAITSEGLSKLRGPEPRPPHCATGLTVSECRAAASQYRREASRALEAGELHTASEWLWGAEWFTYLATQALAPVQRSFQ